MEPLKFNPTYISPVWAGTHLADIRGIAEATAENNYGEAFDISAHPTTVTTIANGPYAGMKLDDAIAAHHDEIVGDLPDTAVLQITWMDPAQSLSVQVHPTEEYAQRVDGDHAKPESWYIAEAAPDAHLIGGSTTTDFEALREAAADDTIGPKYCKVIGIQEGDFVRVPAGTMHALGPGCLAVEIAPFGNLTYRICDWGRGRELHVDKAFDVLDPASTPTVNHLGAPSTADGDRTQLGVSFDEYESRVIDIAESWSCETNGRYQVVTCVSGSATVTCEDGSVELAYTESALVPACCASYTVSGPCRILQSLRHDPKE